MSNYSLMHAYRRFLLYYRIFHGLSVPGLALMHPNFPQRTILPVNCYFARPDSISRARLPRHAPYSPKHLVRRPTVQRGTRMLSCWSARQSLPTPYTCSLASHTPPLSARAAGSASCAATSWSRVTSRPTPRVARAERAGQPHHPPPGGPPRCDR